MEIGLWIGLAVTVFLIGGGVYGHHIESKLWNGGRCSHCENRWIRFDVDSQGGRGYKCRCDYRHVWISYPSIDRSYLA